MTEQNENKQSGKENLTRRITFRLSASEYAQISDDMAVCGLTVSSLARKRLLGVRAARKIELAQGWSIETHGC
ncbi:MAG: hypothetical protein FWG71_10575 [Synergistaceae bacterium]|nr:hypothetical protein [Synergistaceae bacterium]